MIAAVVTGWYPDMAACADDWVTPHLGEPKAPDASLAARYERMFPAYVEARLAPRPPREPRPCLPPGGGEWLTPLPSSPDRSSSPPLFCAPRRPLLPATR